MAKKQKSIPQGSPASSAPSTPRKSATSERIAQEKARLKKLEHELSEKLKLYAHSRQEDEEKTHSSGSPTKPSQNNKEISDVNRTEIEEKHPGPDDAIGGNSTQSLSERQDVNSEQSNQLLGERAVASSKDSEMAEAMELKISAQQMERIRKLQVSVPIFTKPKSQTYQQLYWTQVVYVLFHIHVLYSGIMLIGSPTGH